jgi:hypothetical protein
MATAVIEEYTSALVQNGMVTNVPCGPPLRTQFVTFTTSTQSAAIGDDVGLIGVWVDTNAWAEFGADATAAASSPSFPIDANVMRWFGFKPGSSYEIAFVTR